MMNTLIKRAAALVLSVLVLAALLCGCTETTPQATQGTQLPTETTQAPPETTEPATQPPTEPAEPVEITTDGGVVLVGVIGKDENGWFLAPEQPLNVTAQILLEPSVFENTTRIELFAPEEDNVEKVNYLGDLVTIEGRFTFYRDYLDRLYLQIYQIRMGKTVKQSHAAPDLLPPESGEQDLYDPSVPLPEKIEPKVVDGKYTYNPYMLSMETIKNFGNDFVDFYIEFIDAFLNYEPQCYCPVDNYAVMLSTVAYYEIPLYDACADPFDYSCDYDPETKQITIPYRYSAQEHKQIVDQFFEAVNAKLAVVSPEQTELEKAMKLYTALCTSVTYNDLALEDLDLKATYYAFLHNNGVCITFANAYNLLLNQVGMTATGAGGESRGGEPHGWSLVTIDGERYFCDPTFELNYDGGTGYRFFGMNYADRIAKGAGEKGIYVGKYYDETIDASSVAEESLQVD